MAEMVSARGSSRPGGSAHAAFAAAVRAQSALCEIRSRLDLDTVDSDQLRARLADAWKYAAGYCVAAWTGGVPDEYAEDFAALDSRFILDAPMGDHKSTWTAFRPPTNQTTAEADASTMPRSATTDLAGSSLGRRSGSKPSGRRSPRQRSGANEWPRLVRG
jgi:hypothetical protein